MSNWQTEFPKQDGYYWIRNEPEPGERVTHIARIEYLKHGTFFGTWLDDGWYVMADPKCPVLVETYFRDWEGLAFYGPLEAPPD